MTVAACTKCRLTAPGGTVRGRDGAPDGCQNNYTPVNPPPAELAALVALVEEGSYRAAAVRLGRSVSTVKGQVVSLRQRVRVRTTEQAIYVGTKQGWLRVHDLTD